MRLARGPRPWPIWVFAAAFLGAATYSYILDLTTLPLQQAAFEALLPWAGWDRDWTIVALSAVLSIAFIPVLWICLFAGKVARAIVTVFTAIKLLDVPAMIALYSASYPNVRITYFLEPALIGIAVICLFLPASRSWFNPPQEATHEDRNIDLD